jgi:hypothetical protein
MAWITATIGNECPDELLLTSVWLALYTVDVVSFESCILQLILEWWTPAPGVLWDKKYVAYLQPPVSTLGLCDFLSHVVVDTASFLVRAMKQYCGEGAFNIRAMTRELPVVLDAIPRIPQEFVSDVIAWYRKRAAAHIHPRITPTTRDIDCMLVCIARRADSACAQAVVAHLALAPVLLHGPVFPHAFRSRLLELEEWRPMRATWCGQVVRVAKR